MNEDKRALEIARECFKTISPADEQVIEYARRLRQECAKGELVAWMWEHVGNKSAEVFNSGVSLHLVQETNDAFYDGTTSTRVTPLYTSPQPSADDVFEACAAARASIDYAFVHDCACDFTSRYNLSEQAHHDLELAMQIVARTSLAAANQQSDDWYHQLEAANAQIAALKLRIKELDPTNRGVVKRSEEF